MKTNQADIAVKMKLLLWQLRAQKMGMRIMINFHYSDSWADPAKQNKPNAWKNHSFAELLNDVYNHTFDVILH
jgi:arabinogalactan endo-1,4-beta-galactosidase